MTDSVDVDVVVVGGGPAGWAAAAACGARGLSVVLLAPPERWTASYGCWADELEALDLAETAARRLPTVTAVGTRRHVIRRTYVRVDNEALAGRLRADASAAGVVVVAERLAGHRRADDGHVVTGSGGTLLRSAVVVDASGHAPALVWRPGSRSTGAVQAAYGVVARFDRSPAAEGQCVLMDWTQPPNSDPRVPTFLYALDLGDGWCLAEETSLAAAPAVSIGELQRRLRRRLESTGATIVERAEEEFVAIPMGTPVPPAQAVVGFGAAGGFVHPATGYSLIASLRAAPLLGAVLADAMASGMRGDSLAERAWEGVWPRDRRRVRALHEYGLDVLEAMDAPSIAAFFDCFFELSDDQAAAYVDPMASLPAVTGVMGTMFRRAPWSVRRRLMSGDLRRLLEASPLGGR